MAKSGNYYYEQLNKEQQKAYYAMKEGLLNLQDSFGTPLSTVGIPLSESSFLQDRVTTEVTPWLLHACFPRRIIV